MMNSKWENESAKEADKDFYYMDVFSGMTRNQRRQVEGRLKLAEAPFTPPVKPVEHIELTLNINKDS